ncbi:MAG TPA: sodium:calcium antiporter, partial [Devosiaceae bacterium]|nr:sodium:calcium antiporter [Devosiaceae bacterium]
VFLALGDAALKGRALTYVVASPTVLLQAVACCVLLCFVIAGIALGDIALGPVGVWSTAIFVVAMALLVLVANSRGAKAWQPTHPLHVEALERQVDEDISLKTALWFTLAAGAAILVAGALLALSGEAIAVQSGLGSSFVGALFIGASTSLPEISTVLAAVRMRRYLMAFSDIFGTNILDLSLIFVIDLVYPGPPVLSVDSGFNAFAAALGMLLTLTYAAGLIERRDRSLAGLGIDSWVVLGLYGGGVAVLYTLR